jgi:hypothetical protein
MQRGTEQALVKEQEYSSRLDSKLEELVTLSNQKQDVAEKRFEKYLREELDKSHQVVHRQKKELKQLRDAYDQLQLRHAALETKVQETGHGSGMFTTRNTAGVFGTPFESRSTNETTAAPPQLFSLKSNGTAATPFQPFKGKDFHGSSNFPMEAQYQTITFQKPYQGYSLEELRKADYDQGRRFGGYRLRNA